MAGPSTQFKMLLCEHDRMSRDRILYKLSNWFMEQSTTDSRAAQCSSALQMLCNDNGYQDDLTFKNNMNWCILQSCDESVSLQRVVDAKLSIPLPPVARMAEPAVATPQKARRAIPKKIREMVWKAYHEDSMTGTCWCCQSRVDALGHWHAGHIVSHAHGGKDNVSNLRPVGASCHLSMGTENMDAFKARCYSS